MTNAISLPNPPVLKEENENEAVFEIEGLYPGYGITLGNALKRVLHSSLPGAAVTAVKIDGVKHEFSTIPGVLEDVLTILLNLKQVRFRLFTEEPQTVTIQVTGEQEITGKDIQCSSSIEVVNTDFHIATITDAKTKFSAELIVGRGVGYVSRDSLKNEKVQVGQITLDAIFTPVRKVRYEIENMRVGTATNYDRLRIAIQTDGSISPKDAFLESVNILRDQLSQLERIGTPVSSSDESDVSAEEILNELKNQEVGDTVSLDIALEDLKLSSRTINALSKSNFKTVRDVSKMTTEQLLQLDGFGDKSLGELQRALGNLGITLEQ